MASLNMRRPAAAVTANGSHSEQLPGRLDLTNKSASVPTQDEIEDTALAVNDGREQLGLIRPCGKSFEAYITSGDSDVYLAKCDTRDEALRLIWQART